MEKFLGALFRLKGGVIVIIFLLSIDAVAQEKSGGNLPPNSLSVGGKSFNNVHTYGGRIVDKSKLYNPYLEELFGVPFDPDTYTYQYYYTPPYGHNSPYLTPNDTSNYTNIPKYIPSPIYSPYPRRIGYSSPPSSTSKSESKKEPISFDIVPVIVSVINNLVCDVEQGVKGRANSNFKTRRITLGDWSGDISVYSDGSGRVNIRSSKSYRLSGDFRKIGGSIRFNFDLESQAGNQRWNGNSTCSGGSISISSNRGERIGGYATTSSSSNYYNFSYDSSRIRVRIDRQGAGSDRYFISASGNKYMSGYVD